MARFAVPAGVLVGVGVVSSYRFALHDLDFLVAQARTIATTVLVLAGLYLVLALEAHGRRHNEAVATMCVVLGGLYALAVAVPATRECVELARPTSRDDRHGAHGGCGRDGRARRGGFSPGSERAD